MTATTQGQQTVELSHGKEKLNGGQMTEVVSRVHSRAGSHAGTARLDDT